MQRSENLPKSLVAAVLLLTLLVLGLGGAVVAVKLRPTGPPATAVEQDLTRWEQAVLADPKDDWNRAGLGLALLEAGREGEAQRAFEEALKLNADNWVAAYQLGLIVAGETPDRALDLLLHAARFAPRTNKAAPLVAAGDLMLGRGDAEGAKEAFKRAVADVPFLFDAHLGLAKALEALGDRKGALTHYEEAARYDPSNQAVAEAIARLKGGKS